MLCKFEGTLESKNLIAGDVLYVCDNKTLNLAPTLKCA